MSKQYIAFRDALIKYKVEAKDKDEALNKILNKEFTSEKIERLEIFEIKEEEGKE
ncbi:MAG: hypothetical protein ACOC44_12340 [Promethearchaeia archaeon]